MFLRIRRISYCWDSYTNLFLGYNVSQAYLCHVKAIYEFCIAGLEIALPEFIQGQNQTPPANLSVCMYIRPEDRLQNYLDMKQGQQ